MLELPRRELPPNPRLMCSERLRAEICNMALAHLTGRSFDDGRIEAVVDEVEKRLKRRELPVDWNDDIGYGGIIENLRTKLRQSATTVAER